MCLLHARHWLSWLCESLGASPGQPAALVLACCMALLECKLCHTVATLLLICYRHRLSSGQRSVAQQVQPCCPVTPQHVCLPPSFTGATPVCPLVPLTAARRSAVTLLSCAPRRRARTTKLGLDSSLHSQPAWLECLRSVHIGRSYGCSLAACMLI